MVSENLPEGYDLTFEVHLFNGEAHRLTQDKQHWRCFYLVDESKKKVQAGWPIHLSHGLAHSPYRATFGGIDFDKISFDDLKGFIKKVIEQIKASHFEVTLPPAIYNSHKFTQCYQAFFELGFKPSKSESTAVISVTDRNLYSRFHRGERTKFNRGKHLQFKVCDLDELELVYALLEQNRKEKGYELSLSLQQVQALSKSITLKLFALYDKETMVASCFALPVRSDILYLFYYGHDRRYDKISPTVTLIERIYNYCQQKNISLMDLGTSQPEGEIDQKLLDFKCNMGAELSLKVTFEK